MSPCGREVESEPGGDPSPETARWPSSDGSTTLGCSDAVGRICTVDGEILPLKGHPVNVSLGPMVRLAVAPAAGLGPVLRLVVHMRGYLPGRKRSE